MFTQELEGHRSLRQNFGGKSKAILSARTLQDRCNFAQLPNHMATFRCFFFLWDLLWENKSSMSVIIRNTSLDIPFCARPPIIIATELAAAVLFADIISMGLCITREISVYNLIFFTGWSSFVWDA